MEGRFLGALAAALTALALMAMLGTTPALEGAWPIGEQGGAPPLPGATALAANGHATDVVPSWSRADLTILDGSPATATTGDPFDFNVSVQGGTGVDAVHVTWYFGNRTTEALNESMTPASVDAGGNGTYIHVGLIIPSDSLDSLNYTIAARSGDGTWTTTSARVVEVHDDDLPTFEQDLTPAEIYAGGTVRLRVEVQDNVGGDLGIQVVYWLLNRTAGTPVEMTLESPGIWASDDIPLPSDALDPIEYKFIIVDMSGNVAHSVYFKRTPIDKDPPTIVEDLTGECVKGAPLDIRVSTADNIQVIAAHVTYWYGTTPSGNNETMAPDPSATDTFILSIDPPRHPTGVLRYIVSVTDGRSWTTGPVWERTPVNAPPRPLGPIVWNVTEGSYDGLNLTEHIVDDNDPYSALTVSCNAPNVDVDGLILHARYDMPVADHPIQINVSDGEDSTLVEVTVHIIPTNDAPVITGTPPTTGQVNVTYTYKVTYTDEERDDMHTFALTRAPEGMTVGTDGTVTWRPTRAQHDYHDVDLTLSDGEAIVHHRWTIKVSVGGGEPTNQYPYFTNSPPRAAEVGKPYTWDAAASDPDADDTLYYHMLTGPVDAVFDNRTGVLVWTPQFPGANVSVYVPFEIEVTDGYHRVPLEFTVRVRTPPDAPPEIMGYITDMVISATREIDLSPHMYDPDDPIGNLTWRVQVEEPDLLSVHVDLRSITLQPEEGAEGTTEVVLYLEDPSGLVDSMTFSVRVEEAGPAVPVWLVVTVLVVVIIASVGVISWRRGARRPSPAGTGGRPPLVAEVGGETAPADAAQGPTHIVEEVLIVYHDGRLIADCAREECKTKDADLMSGMLITIQGIIQDGLERGGALESIKYGENIILMACGSYIDIAAVIYGEPDDELKESVASLLARVEGSYAGVIEQWTGDLGVFEGIDAMAAPLLASTEGLARDDIAKADVFVGVTLLSAVDFHRGYVRLKVATINATKDVIVDAAVEVRYDQEMLRLERLDPSTVKLRGDKATLGNVKPGEKKTVAFLFDPQICQETHIDGTLTYYDTKGALQRVEMKRRQADVVCPIFFTKEHANTAMLRRLIKEKLDQSDMRLFTYPPELSPDVALLLGKSVAGGEQVQLVREYVVEGPPFQAEVWYYAETRIKGFQMVMRLSVLEERRAIEYFVASTGMEPVTGLLAEFRRELDHLLEERYAGAVKVKTVRDEVLKREVEMRQLFLFTFGEGEGA